MFVLNLATSYPTTRQQNKETFITDICSLKSRLCTRKLSKLSCSLIVLRKLYPFGLEGQEKTQAFNAFLFGFSRKWCIPVHNVSLAIQRYFFSTNFQLCCILLRYDLVFQIFGYPILWYKTILRRIIVFKFCQTKLSKKSAWYIILLKTPFQRHFKSQLSKLD